MTIVICRFRGEHFFLSNFYRCEFDVPGLGSVRSSEHAYNAMKTLDDEERRAILQAETPAEAKRAGQSVRLRSDWELGGRVAAMLTILNAKFALPDLAGRLSSTGDARLVEGNEHDDNFWGDCTCSEPRCDTPGANMLGELLMAVRALS